MVFVFLHLIYFTWHNTSHFIHVITSGKISSLFWLSNIPHVHIYIYSVLFIHSYINGHLGHFHILSIVHNSLMKSGVHAYIFSN